jgi:hypothetical protein
MVDVIILGSFKGNYVFMDPFDKDFPLNLLPVYNKPLITY